MPLSGHVRVRDQWPFTPMTHYRNGWACLRAVRLATTAVEGAWRERGGVCGSLCLLDHFSTLLILWNKSHSRRLGPKAEVVVSYDRHSGTASWSVQEAFREMSRRTNYSSLTPIRIQ